MENPFIQLMAQMLANAQLRQNSNEDYYNKNLQQQGPAMGNPQQGQQAGSAGSLGLLGVIDLLSGKKQGSTATGMWDIIKGLFGG